MKTTNPTPVKIMKTNNIASVPKSVTVMKANVGVMKSGNPSGAPTNSAPMNASHSKVMMRNGVPSSTAIAHKKIVVAKPVPNQ